MQAFNRIAGVQEASDTNQPSHPTIAPESYPPIPPIPSDDPNDNFDGRSSRRASLHSVGVPTRRLKSNGSLRSRRSGRSRPGSTKGGRRSRAHSTNDNENRQRASEEQQEDADATASEGDDDDNEDDEFAWGPSHPCFPHPNPHCSPTSPEHAATCVIRVKRDWLAAGDLYPQYANLYPEILDPLVSDNEFRFLVFNVNAILKKAFSPYTARAWMDSILGVATGYLWEDLGFTGARIGMHEVENFMTKWNMERERQGLDVRVVMLRTTGFMSLDFVIPDPGIDGVADGEQEEEYNEGP